jgi:hypothetical protein
MHRDADVTIQKYKKPVHCADTLQAKQREFSSCSCSPRVMSAAHNRNPKGKNQHGDVRK